ncbi:macrolide family glycosyltransferase [Phaeacidiphilus oryzae]|uniref:macrolide family glycosyltransferase n=1 Tax=Phaeacidiphilus oryzae TaxID=348818 RepID=UPI000689ACB4|nr:macrolide family glycosyltransferase [Phaeacidiphilus oryzae]
MAHIAFVSLAEAGHLNPTLPVARELMARGHRVSYPADASMAERIRPTGAEIVPYRCEPAADSAAEPAAEPLVIDGMDAAARAALGMLKQLAQVLPQIEAGYRDDRPDVIVSDWLAWAGPMLAAKWGIPRVQSWSAHAASEGYDFGAFADQMFAGSPWKPEFDALLADVQARHGVPPFALRDFYRPAESNLVYQPRAFHVRNETFDDRYAFVGPTRLPGAEPAGGGWGPPGRPLVYVSLGTIISRPDFFRTCVRAFAELPCRVLMSVGDGIEPAALGPLPPGVTARQEVPQPLVLAHADVFVTAAGMNSAMESLAAAVPMVAVPHTPEQRTTADRIAELGLGRVLAPAEATAERLREAVGGLLHGDDTAALHGRLEAMREEICKAGGAPRAADAIESRLPG